MEFFLEAHRIHCRMTSAADQPLTEVRLLGTVLALWLEWRGRPALHASAVVVDGRAVGFLAGNRGGKSSLAAAFLQAGYPLLTDDILSLLRTPSGVLACPGYPQMRFWPHDARRLLGSTAGLEAVLPGQPKLQVPVGEGGFGVFQAEDLPLAALYLPERSAPGEEAELRIDVLSPQAGLIELVRHAFTPRMAEALALQSSRLDLFARLLRAAPVRRLGYPDGYEHLPRTVEAILADLRA
jgi:hypothetical protein